ncbi:hypothetical protein BDV95DRAFT_247881 [Massariosphaeria phaeospora]|uniref:Uncharacterized protein n=1 Tax=Massariosphaeria phaeospora TaxID=100035 RepID=A0A7C8HZ26_9PLEO|nr:hypothetical protein BDV95DRAFT_247881 [Massariosphaeria phaeospora]
MVPDPCGQYRSSQLHSTRTPKTMISQTSVELNALDYCPGGCVQQSVVFPSPCNDSDPAPAGSGHQHTKSPGFAKPYDRFKPQGGGVDGDIFLRFKIRAMDEEEFLVHWARLRTTSGIFTRDESGTLVFRMSSSDLSDYPYIGICRSNLPCEPAARWQHCYDEAGISWLTKPMSSDSNHTELYACGFEVQPHGSVGQYGPSGLTPTDFVARQLLEEEVLKSAGKEIGRE